MSRTPPRPGRPKHDTSYKMIFAHRRSVADLLRGFAGDIAMHLDFATLERLPASFVSEHLDQHHADMLWKIRTRNDQWLYLLILLEFQSTIDRRMARRMLNYTMQILDGLGDDELGPGGTYPPVLPVVIYNGERRWNAPTDLRDHFPQVPEALLGYLPRHRYLLIDLRAPDASLLVEENIVSLMAILERAKTLGQLEEVGAAMADWLVRVGDAELLDSVEAWITQVLTKRTGPSGTASELQIRKKEEGTMSSLAERVKRWGDELNQEWLTKGLERGIEQGIERERALVRGLAARRFGPVVAQRLTPLLEQLSDADRIAAVATGVIECETGDEFIARAKEVQRIPSGRRVTST